jgi:hypothetical protein
MFKRSSFIKKLSELYPSVKENKLPLEVPTLVYVRLERTL